jgi:acetolactate synthase small subunit
MMRVLNAFTRRGLVIESVWCGPSGDHHRAHVLVDAQAITIEQTVRELESTVGVDGVAPLNESEEATLLRHAKQ